MLCGNCAFGYFYHKQVQTNKGSRLSVFVILQKCWDKIVGENTIDKGTKARLLGDSSVYLLLELLRHVADS